MLLSDWRVLVRRWYVVVIGIPATLLLCWVGTLLAPAQYQVDSSILMLPPKTVTDGKPTNPYLNLGGLDGIADVLSAAMEDGRVGEAMTKAGIDAEYEINRDLTVAGPVIILQVKGATREDALKAQEHLLQRMPVTLDTLQASVGVNSNIRITQTVITREEVPATDRKSQFRVLLVLAFLGIGLTYLVASLLDGILMSRRPVPAGASRTLDPPVPTERPPIRHTQRPVVGQGSSRWRP